MDIKGQQKVNFIKLFMYQNIVIILINIIIYMIYYYANIAQNKEQKFQFLVEFCSLYLNSAILFIN